MASESSRGTFPNSKLQVYTPPQYQPELDAELPHPSMTTSTRRSASRARCAD